MFKGTSFRYEFEENDTVNVTRHENMKQVSLCITTWSQPPETHPEHLKILAQETVSFDLRPVHIPALLEVVRYLLAWATPEQKQAAIVQLVGMLEEYDEPDTAPVDPEFAALLQTAPRLLELVKEQVESMNSMPPCDLNYSGHEWIVKANEVLHDYDSLLAEPEPEKEAEEAESPMDEDIPF